MIGERNGVRRGTVSEERNGGRGKVPGTDSATQQRLLTPFPSSTFSVLPDSRTVGR